MSEMLEQDFLECIKFIEKFGIEIDREKLKSAKRSAESVFQRALVFFFLYSKGHSLARTGSVLGRDHSTVLHGLKYGNKKDKVWQPQYLKIIGAMKENFKFSDADPEKSEVILIKCEPSFKDNVHRVSNKTSKVTSDWLYDVVEEAMIRSILKIKIEKDAQFDCGMPVLVDIEPVSIDFWNKHLSGQTAVVDKEVLVKILKPIIEDSKVTSFYMSPLRSDECIKFNQFTKLTIL